MRFKVFSQGFTRQGKKPIRLHKTDPKTGSDFIRCEIIDTKKNSLFFNTLTEKDIKEGYESFWNDMNTQSEAIVKVLTVEKI